MNIPVFLLQNINFLLKDRWILILLVEVNQEIALLCWTRFPGLYLSFLYPLWVSLWYLLFLVNAIFLLRKNFWCSWPSQLFAACGISLLKGLNILLFLLAKICNICFLEWKLSFICSWSFFPNKFLPFCWRNCVSSHNICFNCGGECVIASNI